MIAGGSVAFDLYQGQYNGKPVGQMLIPSAVAKIYADITEEGQSAVYPDIKTSGVFSRGVQKITGFTWLSERVAKGFIKKEINKNISGDYKLKMDLFSGTNLIKGYIRSISFRGEDLSFQNQIKIQSLSFATQEETPIFIHKSSKPVLIRPMKMDFTSEVTSEAVDQFVKSPLLQKELLGLKIPLPPFDKPVKMDILEPRANFDGDRVHIHALLNMSGASKDKGLKMDIWARPVPEEGWIGLEDVKVRIPEIEDADQLEPFLEKYFVTLIPFHKIRVSRHKVDLDFREIEIKDEVMKASGNITLRPDDKRLRKLRQIYQ